jgi:hypothetical protein
MRQRVFRALAVVLGLLVAAALGAALFPEALAQGVRQIVQAWPVVTPPPPAITAPRGSLPEGAVGLQQWVQARRAPTSSGLRPAAFCSSWAMARR